MRWRALTYLLREGLARVSPALRSGIAALLIGTKLLTGQSATAVEAPTTIHVRTQMVLLDVAVVDKKGRPTASRLGREDFAITEDGKPQQLLVFEPPSPHSATARTVFVLDALNISSGDNAYYRFCLQQYLEALPKTLSAPAELIVLTATSLRIVQPLTQSRAELLSTLAHLPASEVTLPNIEPERLGRTLSALESIAVANLGDAGRTNVVWLGPGDGIDMESQTVTWRAQTERFVRYLTNTLLESRTTLYVVFPPEFTQETSSHVGSEGGGAHAASVADPYHGGINFPTLAAQTGGSVYAGTNDLGAAMRQAVDLGSGYYTLGYRPDYTIMDGRFRQIRVTARKADLHIVTKSGYYAPELQEQDAPQTIQVFQMTEAGKSMLPYEKFELRIINTERSPDGKTMEFTISAAGKDLDWRPENEDGSLAEFTVGGLSLSKQGKVLSSHFRNVNMMARSQVPGVLRETSASFKLTLALPSGTDRVRLVVSSRSSGRLGSVDASRAAINTAAVK